MIYGYNPSYFLSLVFFLVYPLESFSTRIIHSWRDGSALQLEFLFYRIESSYGLDWPYN